MKLLAIDTATPACSVALWIDGQIESRTDQVPRAHGRTVLPMVRDLLDSARLVAGDLDALAFGRGPGAFTGLRIAAGVAQGLAEATGLLVVPVSDLAALAQQVLTESRGVRVLVCMDARMDEVYWGTFAADGAGLAIPLGAEAVGPAASVRPGGGAWTGIGSGFAVDYGIARRYPGIATAEAAAALPRATDIAQLAVRDFDKGLAVTADKALPVYLRNEVAWRKSSG